MMTQAALIALINTCSNAISGSHYVGGEPDNLPVLRGYVQACAKAAADIQLRHTANEKRELARREILAIMLDREVELAYAGLGDAATALVAAKSELRNIGEILKMTIDAQTAKTFEDQADLVGGQIQTLEAALKVRTKRKTIPSF